MDKEEAKKMGKKLNVEHISVSPWFYYNYPNANIEFDGYDKNGCPVFIKPNQ